MQSLRYFTARRMPGVLALLFTLTFVPCLNAADAATYKAIQDAYTKSSQGSKNFGKRSDVRTQKWSSITGFVKFELDTLPSQSEIDSAKLRIKLRDVVVNGRITVHRVLGNWSEGGITHKNKPKLSGSLASFNVDSSKRGKTISVNVTKLVRELSSKGSNSIAFVTSKANVGMGSRESGAPIRLEVTTTESGSGGGSGGGGGGGGGGSGGNGESLDAIADAYTKAKDAQINFGGRADVRAQKWSSITGFAKFDLGQVASDANSDSAQLRIRIRDVSAAGQVTVHRVLGNWNEGSITHANKPSLSSALGSFNVSGSDAGKTISVDASALARELLQNRSNNYGIALVTANGNIGMGSRESGAPIQFEIQTSSSGGGGGNQSPSITGIPPGLVSADSSYDFRPQASDPENDALQFSINNKPAWATFNSGSGRLYGTPSLGNVGDYRNISITVSDGTNSATLGPFDIEVAEGGNGRLTLSWIIPTQNTDGSQLTDLSSFRIDWYRTGSSAQGSVNIGNPTVSTYVVENLAAGTYDFTVVAINSKGISSAPSNSARATVN